MSVQGVKLKNQVLHMRAAFKAKTKRTAKGFRAGLIQAGAFLQRESMKIVPIKTGDLRESADTQWEGSGFDTVVTVGYGTDYALYVHENLEARHKPGKEAKFLEKPLREKRDRMIEIIAEGEHGGMP